MDGARTRSSAGLAHGDGGTETALSKVPLLPWLNEAAVKVVVAADDDRDDLDASATVAKAGKRPSSTAQAGLARGIMKVVLSEVAEIIRTKFERSIPAAKFGHVAYIR